MEGETKNRFLIKKVLPKKGHLEAATRTDDIKGCCQKRGLLEAATNIIKCRCTKIGHLEAATKNSAFIKRLLPKKGHLEAASNKRI